MVSPNQFVALQKNPAHTDILKCWEEAESVSAKKQQKLVKTVPKWFSANMLPTWKPPQPYLGFTRERVRRQREREERERGEREREGGREREERKEREGG